MSINLLHAVQKNLGYPPLKKVDANTQVVIVEAGKPHEDRFSQATIPAVLIALYKYSRTDDGAKAILFGELSADWTTFIFADRREKAIKEIAAYSGHSADEVIEKLNRIAKEAVRLVRENVTTGDILDIKKVLADTRNDVLPYLPEDLQMGSVLHDNTLDDRTNKMEGPISSLMHAIGGSFSGSDSDEKNETNISK